MHRFISALLILSLLPASGRGQDAECPQLAGRWGYGTSLAIAADADYVYIGNGTVLQIFSLADPAHPALTSEVMLDGVVYGITLAKMDGSQYYAFVAASRAGLIIVDISDPFLPKSMGSVDTPYHATDIAIQGRYAYVADWNIGGPYGSSSALYIMDISDVSRPFIVGSLSLWTATGLSVNSHYAFVAAGSDGLKIIDVQNPSTPREVTAIIVADEVQTVRLKAGEDGTVIAYVGCWESLEIYDVTDPRHPRNVGSCGIIGNNVAFAGSLAYVASMFSGLAILDVTHPDSPQLVGYWLTDERTPAVAVPSGDYAYLADWSALRTIDVRDPSAPLEIANVETGHYWGFIIAEGPLAYVTGYYESIAVIDFSDAAHPKELGRFAARHHAMGLAKEGDILYVADVWGVEILDVSNPAEIREIGYAETRYSAWDVAARSGMLFVASYDKGLQIINAVDPSNPHAVAHLDTPGDADRVEVYGTYVLIADVYGGLRMIDVSTPSNPREVWADDTIEAYDVAVSAGKAYIADWTGYVHIYDLWQPEQPKLINRIKATSYPESIAVKDDLLFYTSWQSINGLYIWDIADPYAARQIGYVDTPGFPAGAAVSGHRVYCADSEAGVEAYDFSGCADANSHARPLGKP